MLRAQAHSCSLSIVQCAQRQKHSLQSCPDRSSTRTHRCRGGGGGVIVVAPAAVVAAVVAAVAGVAGAAVAVIPAAVAASTTTDRGGSGGRGGVPPVGCRGTLPVGVLHSGGTSACSLTLQKLALSLFKR